MLSNKGITSPKGKVFLGWKCEEDSVRYYPGSLALMRSGGLHMKAEWGDKAKAVSLIYDFNYDNFGIAKYKTQDIFSKVSELMENDRLKVANDFKSFGEKPAGYEFVGWYFDKACSKPVGEMLQLDSKDMDKENRIYAGWRKIKAENPSNSPN